MLKCVKEDIKIEGKWLWQEDQNEQTLDIFNVPKKTYLLFGVFVLDVFIRDVNPILQSCYDKLMRILEEWNKYYPWSEYNGVSLRFDTLQDKKYLLGQLCVEDNLEQEESLIVTLLRLCSSEMGEQVFIKIADTDGDFLLSNCHETIPGNYEYPVGNNRLWLQNGKFVVIPDTLYPNRGLQPKECIDTLLNTPFRCVQLENISKRLDELYSVKDFPNKQLSDLGLLTLDISCNKASDVITSNPKILNFLIKSLFSTEIDIKDIIKNSNSSLTNNVTETHQFLISKNHFDLLLLYLQINHLKDDSSKISKCSGILLTNCLANLLELETIELVEFGNNMTDETKWATSPIFKLHNFSDLDYSQKYELEKREQPTDKLMDLFTQFFKDNEKDSNNKNINDGQEFDISENNNSDDEAERKAKEYLATENSGINEDDFFEFFLKEALHLKDNDMEELRRDLSEPQISEVQDVNTAQDPFLDDIDEVDEIDDMLDEIRSKEDVSKAFKDMFESLNLEGASNGPFESLLRNLANHSGS